MWLEEKELNWLDQEEQSCYNLGSLHKVLSALVVQHVPLSRSAQLDCGHMCYVNTGLVKDLGRSGILVFPRVSLNIRICTLSADSYLFTPPLLRHMHLCCLLPLYKVQGFSTLYPSFSHFQYFEYESILSFPQLDKYIFLVKETWKGMRDGVRLGFLV